jgi:spermidine/putrescine-binding protein
MSDIITQTRLSLRLDTYLSNYKEKNVKKDNPAREEWDTVWKAADLARTNNNLTPELVDDVRLALNKL